MELSKSPKTWFDVTGENFYKLIEIAEKRDPWERYYVLQQLCTTIERNFDAAKNADVFLDLALILYKVISSNLRLNDQTIPKLDTFLEAQMNPKCTNDDIELILKLIYQTLITFIENNVNDLGDSLEVFEMVDNYLFNEYKPIQTLSLCCLNLILDNYKNPSTLDKIWNKITKENCSLDDKLRVLNHLHNYFLKDGKIYKNKEFWEFLYSCLEENTEPIVRKQTIYILKATIETLKILNEEINLNIENYINWNEEYKDECYKTWMIFFTIFENLQEKQSHLILPALEMFPKLKNTFRFKDFVISEMLKHKNVLVLKWSIDYILKTLNINDMINDSALYDFLLSLNNLFLYTKEKKFDDRAFGKFIQLDVERFLKIFSKINWKSVPMHVCLKTLYMDCKNTILCDEQTLLDIATKVRQLLNRNIREKCKTIYFKLFENQLNSLKIVLQVISAIETKNDEDCLSLWLSLFGAIRKCKGNYGEICININDLEIFSMSDNVVHEKDVIIRLFLQSNPSIEEMLKALSFVNLRLAVDSEFSGLILEKLSIEDLPPNPTIDDVKQKIETSNDPNINFFLKFIFFQMELAGITQLKFKDYKIFETIENCKISGELKQIFVDTCVQVMRLKRQNEWILENKMLLIDVGGDTTLEEIIWALFDKEDYIITTAEFDRILTELRSFIKKNGCSKVWRRLHLLVGYIMKSLPDQRYEFLNKILDIDPESYDIFNTVYDTFHKKITGAYVQYESGVQPHSKFLLNDDERDFLIRGLTFGVALHGDEKTEWEYEKQLDDSNKRWPSEVRYKCFEILEAISRSNLDKTETFLTNLMDKILEQSLALNAKKPRYFDNSKQHRLKLRLTQALALLQACQFEWREDYLVTILQENNQTNVNIIMEIIVGTSIEWGKLEDLLKKITDLPPSCQVSLLHITYIFLHEQQEPDLKKKVFEYIMPLIMGQNFSTRFYAQFFLAKSSELFAYDDTSSLLVETIKKSLLPFQEKVAKEVRFVDPFRICPLDKEHILHTIPCKTNMALDELFGKQYKIERLFEETTTPSPEDSDAQPHLEILDNIQRKMNPMKLGERITSNIFYTRQAMEQKNDADIIVVASLINKLPNLGGIARTCEVFGVGQLVLSSLRHSENPEFKSLSMTAEKWLDIIEVKSDAVRDFLCKKKFDGYKIVGAEQTKDSICFTRFQFPKKTVLLLGHEKEGIPGNLISLLDHAVEVPQFGMVRSLNVHVTAALFIWEYRKQMIER